MLHDWKEMNVLRRDFVVREPLLVVILVLITIVFSTLTHAYSRAYDRRRNQLGQQWFAEGNAELQKNKPAAAVDAFRTSLIYDSRNWDYRLHLAEALSQVGQTRQALNYYQSLWQLNPKNGVVNLHLAEFAVRSGQVADAERYFSGAIFGDWPNNSADHRREALFELINFYLQRGDTGQAESQLIILSANLPEDPVLHSRVADLYAHVGDYQRALDQYRRAFHLDPKYFPALFGAGEAAFHVGDYHAAETYLTRASHEDAAGPEVKNLLQITQAASALNPFERGLRESEKIQRVLRSFQIASGRLDACSSRSGGSLPSKLAPLQQRRNQWKPNANPRYLSRHPDQIDPLFVIATEIEKQSQSVCGEPAAEDSALLALANSHPLDEK